MVCWKWFACGLPLYAMRDGNVFTRNSPFPGSWTKEENIEGIFNTQKTAKRKKLCKPRRSSSYMFVARENRESNENSLRLHNCLLGVKNLILLFVRLFALSVCWKMDKFTVDSLQRCSSTIVDWIRCVQTYSPKPNIKRWIAPLRDVVENTSFFTSAANYLRLAMIFSEKAFLLGGYHSPLPNLHQPTPSMSQKLTQRKISLTS